MTDREERYQAIVEWQNSNFRRPGTPQWIAERHVRDLLAVAAKARQEDDR